MSYPPLKSNPLCSNSLDKIIVRKRIVTRSGELLGGIFEKMADAPCVTDADSSRSIEDGALYTVKERLETFKDCSWPFDSGLCTPVKVKNKYYRFQSSSPTLARRFVVLQMAEAGFYYCGTAQAPDWVRCVVCHQDMDGWEENDDPRYRASIASHLASWLCAFEYVAGQNTNVSNPNVLF